MTDSEQQELLKQIQTMSPDESKEILKELVASITLSKDELRRLLQGQRQGKRGLRELRGLGKGLDLDVAEYLHRERASWNG